jgi:hypothetical protein
VYAPAVLTTTGPVDVDVAVDDMSVGEVAIEGLIKVDRLAD